MNAWGMTDQGRARPINQDAFIMDVAQEEGQAVFAICDGMGGANAGHVASRLALNTFFSAVKAAFKPAMSKNYIQNILLTAINEANNAVFHAASEDKELFGMGTTLVAAVLSGKNCVVANVGDSRAYKISEDGIRQITKDHSFVAEMVERGEITEEEADRHPGKHLITRALGAEKQVWADFFNVNINEGQSLLLCSDGLTSLVSEQEILFEALHGGDSSRCPGRLIKIANERGGYDNITLILVVR